MSEFKTETQQAHNVMVKPNKIVYWVIAVLAIVCIISSLVNIYAIYTNLGFSKRLDKINEQVQLLDAKVKSQESLTELIIKNENERAALVNISTPNDGFDYAKYRSNTFLIILRDISPHLNGGYKATISIGNMSNARFDGFKIKYYWGFTANDKLAKEVFFNDNLNPGSWHHVTLYLSAPPNKNENLLNICVITEKISLK